LILGTLTLGGANPGEFKKPSPNELCSGVTLAPGQPCTVWVRFRPTSAGAEERHPRDPLERHQRALGDGDAQRDRPV